MTTVVDTNVLIDILSGSTAEIKAAENALHIAGGQGRLLFPMICYAELAGRFKSRRNLDSFLSVVPVKLMPLSADAAFLAGGFYQAYRPRGRTRTGMLADCLVAAQAQLGADGLLTTDQRFFGTSFPKLVSVSPVDLA